MTARTQFGTRKISVNLMDCDTIFGGDILQFGDKFRLGEVVHLFGGLDEKIAAAVAKSEDET